MIRMELIDRYVAAVGRRLPSKTRADIEAELRSLIMDAIDERRAAGGEPSEEDVVNVLKSFGSPAEVAARYSPDPHYLIGPQLFDAYRLVVAIVLGAVTLGLGIALALDLGINGVSLVEGFGEFLSGLVSGVLSALGSVTIVFAVLERALSEKDKEAMAGATRQWDPRRLPPTADADAVKISDSVMAICFTLLALVVFNVFMDRLGVYYARDGEWRYTAVLRRDVLASFLPYLNILFVAGLLHHTILLAQRRWSIGSRVFSLVIGAASLVLLGYLLRATIIDASAFMSLGGSASPEQLESLAKIIAGVLRGVFVVAIVGTIVEMVKQVVAMVKSVAGGGYASR
jgi:hypothetical protein